MEDFVGVEMGEEFAHVVGLAGEEEVGGDFVERFEDKPAEMSPGMREDQCGRLAGL